MSHITAVYRYLQLRPAQDCADKWAAFIRDSLVDPILGSHSQLAMNASGSQQTAEPDIQARLLRPLLAGLSNEFNDTGARMQARAIFEVHPRSSCPISD